MYICALLSTYLKRTYAHYCVLEVYVRTYVCTYVLYCVLEVYIRMCSTEYLEYACTYTLFTSNVSFRGGGGVLVAGKANKRASNDFTQVPIAELEMFSLHPLPTSGDKSCKAIKLQF